MARRYYQNRFMRQLNTTTSIMMPKMIDRVTPYSNNIARSLLKEPKFYFYDHNHSSVSDGAKLENVVANALLKELHFMRDVLGDDVALHYLRTKDGKELDFLISINAKPTHIIEVKMTDDCPARAFEHFEKFIPDAKKIQLVKNIDREKTYNSGIEVRSLVKWLAKFTLGESQTT